MLWPPIRYSYRTVNNEIPEPAPAKPSWMYDADERCAALSARRRRSRTARIGNWNWLGTDDQARDVLARVIYGFRISVLFGLILTLASAVIGVAAGAVQGYFGGWIDLIFQRFIEIWSSMPVLYLLLIIAAILPPGFCMLLGIMLLFSWVSLRRRRARRVPARAQFRVCQRGARARRRQPRRSCSATSCPTRWWRR